jgi:hypothetical protein
MDSTKIQMVAFELELSGGDETQYVNWGSYTIGSDGSEQQASVQDIYRWWWADAMNFESYVWKNDASPSRQYAQGYIENWDGASQTFDYQYLVFQFTL